MDEIEINKNELDINKYKAETDRIRIISNRNNVRAFIMKLPLILLFGGIPLSVYFMSGKNTNFELLIKGLENIINLNKSFIGVTVVLALSNMIIYFTCRLKHRKYVEQNKALQLQIDKNRTSSGMNEHGDNEDLI